VQQAEWTKDITFMRVSLTGLLLPMLEFELLQISRLMQGTWKAGHAMPMMAWLVAMHAQIELPSPTIATTATLRT
jgi:hypothetical protein